MIFGVLKLKFDEDKACSLLSQILTKSTKSARKTSRKNKAKYFFARRGTFKFGDRSYHVGNDRAKFKSNEV